MEITRFRFEPEALERFLAFPSELYRDDPNVFSLALTDPTAQLKPDSFLLDKVEHVNFLAKEGDRVLGRITASIHREHQAGSGMVGFFEVIEDPDVSERLLNEAEDWLKEKGCSKVLGPIDLSIWNGYRLMTAGFGERAFWSEPYNPSYYPAFFEKAGYRVIQEWSSTLGGWEDRHLALSLYKKRYEQALEQGYRFVSLTPERLDEEIDEILKLLAASFRNFVGFTPLSSREFEAVANPLKAIADLETIFLVYDPEGVPAAFQITLPDPRPDLKCPRYLQMYTGKGAAGKNAGLGKAVLYATIKVLHDRNEPVEMVAALMSAGNHSRAIAAGVTAPLKSYALYEKAL